MKIDVEGMEQDVVQGASETIARHTPALYVENDRKEKSQALIELLFSLDYRLYWHVVPMFNPSNYYGEEENIFGRVSSINMLGLPRSRPIVIEGLREILSPSDRPNALH